MALFLLTKQEFKNSTKSLLYGGIAQTFTSSYNARIAKITVPLYRENKNGYSGVVTMQILKTDEDYFPSTDPDDILYSQEYDVSLLWGFPSDTEFNLTTHVDIENGRTYAIVFWWDGRYGPGGSDDRLIFWDYTSSGGQLRNARYVYDTTDERWELDPGGGRYRYYVYGYRKPEIKFTDPADGHSGIYKKMRIASAWFTYAINHVFYIDGHAYNGQYQSSTSYDYCLLPNYLSIGGHSLYVTYASVDNEDWIETSDTISFNIIDTPSLPERQLLAGNVTSDKIDTTSISEYEVFATLFTAVAGQLTHVRMSLARRNSTTVLPDDEMTVEIRTVNESDMLPTSTVLATGKLSTYPMAFRPSTGYFDTLLVITDLEAELDNAVELENGKTYALVYYAEDIPVSLGMTSTASPWDSYGHYYYDGITWVYEDGEAELDSARPKRMALFYTNVSAEIEFVRLRIGKDGAMPTCDMLVEIYQAEGGVPVGSALSSKIVDTEQMPDSSDNYYTLRLNESIFLEESKYYAIVLTLQNPQLNDFLWWDGYFYASIDSEMLVYVSSTDTWLHYTYALPWCGLMGQETFIVASPEPIYPADGQSNVEDWPLVLEWTCDDDPDEYRVYFRQTPFGGGELQDGFNSNLIGVLKRNGESPAPTYLVMPEFIENIFTKWPQADTQYSWKVVAIWHREDGDYVSEELPIPYSSQWNFTTPPFGTGTGIYYLNLPINPTPFNEDPSVDTRIVEATWENGGGALRYDVYFQTRDYYLSHDGNLPKVASNVLDASKVFSLRAQGLSYGTTYLWRVNPKNNVFTREGTLWEFTTQIVGSGTGIPLPDGYYANFSKKLIVAADDTIWYED